MLNTVSTKTVVMIATLLVLVGSALPGRAANPAASADEVIAKHLDSVGSAQARSAVKSRAVEGAVKFRVMSGGTGFAEGKSVFLTDGRKSLLFFSFPGGDYKGERFVYNGDKTQVHFATPRQTRSNLGLFVFTYDTVLREGLLTGPLSTAWPLADLKDRKAKVAYEGLKTIDGLQAHVLRYTPKKNPDLTILMYFDVETYHLMRVDYSLSVRAGIGGAGGPDLSPQQSVPGTTDTGPIIATGQGGETATARQYETRYKLTEKYSAYTTVDGLTLPSKYEIQFSQEQKSGITSLTGYEVTVSAIKSNVSPDPRNFEVK